MCGIIGAIRRDTPPVSDRRIELALNSLAHRGPDGRGAERFTIAGREVILAHTRLSIIDLTSGGHQPMTSTDGRHTIVFNGEIYNFHELRRELETYGKGFNTQSDTEVLLTAWQLWGEECLPRLVGMFAFAIVDHQRRRITLARDAFGMKPLFLSLDGDDLFFGSEISSLFAIMARRRYPDLERAYRYLVFGQYDIDAGTFYRNIFHLPPGHLLGIDLESRSMAEPVRWWWPEINAQRELTLKRAAEEVRESFLSSVRMHLRSDVAVGAALSGGIDSSAIVCAIRSLEPDMPLRTFSFCARDSKADEEHWANLINNHVGAIPHKIVIRGEEVANDLDDLIRTQGEPFGGTSIYAQYRVFKAAREAGVIVTLDGQGADELFAGYPDRYPSAYLRSLAERGEFGRAAHFVAHWSRLPGRGIRKSLLTIGDAFTPRALRGLALKVAGYSPEPAWLSGDWLREQGIVPGDHSTLQSDDSGHGRRLTEQLRSAITGGGLARLLRHGDRNSMRWSVESRMPFLTTQLADLTLSLPEPYLLSNTGVTKLILRTALRGIVPDIVLDRHDKVGFETPERNWLWELRGSLDSWLENAEELPFLNAEVARSVVADMANGQRPFSRQAWRLINYCRWAQLELL
jgi:asparagine synthase (glutamine-hydrolysing)